MNKYVLENMIYWDSSLLSRMNKSSINKLPLLLWYLEKEIIQD